MTGGALPKLRASPSRTGPRALAEPIRLAGEGLSPDYAADLLESLGLRVERVASRDGSSREPDHHQDWAESGAMQLTGLPTAEPLAGPAAIASCMRGAALALSQLSAAQSGDALADLDAPALLGERAALAQPKPLERQGSIAPGGSCRMLACTDGWLALNLARSDDARLLPAWLESSLSGEVWQAVSAVVATRSRDALVDRARLMSLPAAPLERPGDARARPWCREVVRGSSRVPLAPAPLVVDLSSLWAGPLCGQLLAASGARVLKLESFQRPDGARDGSPAFFDRMNGGKQSLALDIDSDLGRRQLRALLERADIVIESNRPRALRQLGIEPAAIVRGRPGLTWLCITGYGQDEPESNWVAFGDDAAAAAGLTATADCGTPVFCGDAIADPLTGLHATVAALASWLTGGGRLLDVSLRNVAAKVATVAAANPGRATTQPLPPRARPASQAAAPLGRDTDRVLAELGIRC